MIVNEQDVVPWLDITMLVGIIQQDNLHIPCCLVRHKPLNATPPIGIYSNIDIGELLLYLPRLIANLFH